MSLDRRAALLPLAALLAGAAFLLLADLGGPWLWEDEADTALFARAIVREGLPLAWDGRSFIDSDDGLRVAEHALGRPLVMVGTPWLPYYAAAASFAWFGESEWAARLPFALCALASVAVLYGLVLRGTGSRRAAFAAGALLLASTQFLLYGREARSYAPNLLLTLLVLAGFLRLGERRRDPWLALAAVLLFHVQILPAALALAACALACLHPAHRRRFVPLLARAPWVMAATLPWLALSWSAAGTNWTPLESPAALLPRLGQLGVESWIAVPWLGWALLLPLAARRLGAGDRGLLALCGAWLAAWLVLTPLALSQPLLEVVGLRYVPALLAIAAAITGILLARASGRSVPACAAGLALFGATWLAGPALPWLAIGETQRAGGVLWQAPRAFVDKIFNTSWLAFVRGLGAQDPGTLPAIVERLERDAGPDDVLLANFGWDSLAWYAGRPLGLRISPDALLRTPAAALGLPGYVFGLEGAAWLVWRGDNEAWLGYPMTLYRWRLDEVRSELAARGARLEELASFPETLWENRPELYWHRFPHAGHPFLPRALAAGPLYSPARLFRIRWTADTRE